MELKHLIDYCDITDTDLEEIYELAADIIASPRKYASACSGKIMATLFYEPSTRTQLSFQTAMMRLGGTVMGFSDPNSSSVKKGESLRDTVKVISTYADITVIRNPVEGAAYAASLYSSVPVINAGDGGHLHPTQTLADIFTIRRHRGNCDGLCIGFCGDLLYGRTVHSLISALMRYKNVRIRLISTPQLTIPEYLRDKLDRAGIEYSLHQTIDECIGELDVLYMTRIQKERFSSEDEYRRQAGVYVLTEEKMKAARSDMIVMHPLPKVDEISFGVDDDPRAAYFDQVRNGLYVRMALILLMCGANGEKYESRIYPPPAHERCCRNPRCITNFEKYLPELSKRVGERQACAYCDCLK